MQNSGGVVEPLGSPGALEITEVQRLVPALEPRHPVRLSTRWLREAAACLLVKPRRTILLLPPQVAMCPH